MTEVAVIEVDQGDRELMTRWLAADLRGFHSAPAPDLDEWLARVSGRRLWAGLDGDRVVATFGDFPAHLPVPGTVGEPASSIPGHLITSVTVASTHRRRGVLARWMRRSLGEAREAGAAVASLIASEAPIYGRFGFAPAIDHVTWRVDAARAAVPPDTGACPVHGTHDVDLVEDDDLLRCGPSLYEAARRLQPAAPPRDDSAWPTLLNPREGPPATRLTLAHRARNDAAGGTGSEAGGAAPVDGYARVRVDSRWEHRNPASTATVEDSAVLDPRVGACLWRAVLSLDLIATVAADDRPLGEPVADLLVDRRAAREVERADLYWWRVLDPARALATRGWSAAGDLTIEVTDPDGWAAGRWRLDVDPAGRATVTPTTRSPDLTLPAPTLAALLPGARRARGLWAAGLVDEHTPAAVARLDTMATAPPAAHVRYQWF